MLPANSTFDCRLNFTTFLNGHSNQLPYTILVYNSKWIMFQNTLINIHWKELCDIISTITKCHLSQIVCTERKEIRFSSNFMSSKCCTRNFNHCTNLVFY